MTIDEINTIRLALDTPEHNRHYVKHTTDAKMILNKEQEAINYTHCCEELRDEYLQPELERRAKDVYRFYEDGTLTWKTKDGNKLLITEMSDTHIVNSINMLIKKNKYLDQYTEAIVKILRRELKSRK